MIMHRCLGVSDGDSETDIFSGFHSSLPRVCWLASRACCRAGFILAAFSSPSRGKYTMKIMSLCGLMRRERERPSRPIPAHKMMSFAS